MSVFGVEFCCVMMMMIKTFVTLPFFNVVEYIWAGNKNVNFWMSFAIYVYIIKTVK